MKTSIVITALLIVLWVQSLRHDIQLINLSQEVCAIQGKKSASGWFGYSCVVEKEVQHVAKGRNESNLRTYVGRGQTKAIHTKKVRLRVMYVATPAKSNDARNVSSVLVRQTVFGKD